LEWRRRLARHILPPEEFEALEGKLEEALELLESLRSRAEEGEEVGEEVEECLRRISEAEDEMWGKFLERWVEEASRPLRPPDHTITFYMRSDCPACIEVDGELEEVERRNPGRIEVVRVNVDTREGRKMFEAVDVPGRKVPLVVVDGEVAVQGSRNFPLRLNYALKLAELLPREVSPTW